MGMMSILLCFGRDSGGPVSAEVSAQAALEKATASNMDLLTVDCR